MRSSGGRVRNGRGSTLAMMAVMLFGMLALAAFAIDLASLRDARTEAQRAADTRTPIQRGQLLSEGRTRSPTTE